MNVHEYQAKQILRSYGAPVSEGRAITKADEAKKSEPKLSLPAQEQTQALPPELTAADTLQQPLPQLVVGDAETN